MAAGANAETNRWYPVLQRYIGYIEGRVKGLGGNPSQFAPSPWGVYGAPPVIQFLRLLFQCPKDRNSPARSRAWFTATSGISKASLWKPPHVKLIRFCSREAKVESPGTRALARTQHGDGDCRKSRPRAAWSPSLPVTGSRAASSRRRGLGR